MKSIPAATRQKIESEENTDALIVLCELRHPQIDGVIRLANSVTDVVSNGNTYVGFPFSLQMPSTSDLNSKGRIEVQNVDTRMGKFLQSLRSPPMFEILLITLSDPNTWLIHLRKLWLRNISGNPITLSADIDTWDLSTEPWPARRVVASEYPAVFWV